MTTSEKARRPVPTTIVLALLGAWAAFNAVVSTAGAMWLLVFGVDHKVSVSELIHGILLFAAIFALALSAFRGKKAAITILELLALFLLVSTLWDVLQSILQSGRFLMSAGSLLWIFISLALAAAMRSESKRIRITVA